MADPITGNGGGTLESVGGTPPATTNLPGPTEGGTPGTTQTQQGQSTQGSGTTPDPIIQPPGQTPAGTQTQAQEPTFFDPKSIENEPELLKAYKSMQTSYGKAMTAVSKDRQKLEAYDSFMSDPMKTIESIAKQYGFQLSKAGDGDATQTQNADGTQKPDWQPNSWDEVMTKFETRATENIMKQLQPLLSRVQGLQQQNIEKSLSDIDPGWQQYEDTMKTNLRDHPTLANSPEKLYQLSVPSEVLQARATQTALDRIQTKGQSTLTSGQSTLRREQIPEKMPVGLSLSDSVALAKQALNPNGTIKPEYQHLFGQQ